ncbi:probable U6 snRNA-associated Sm-like protein LSm4 [Paramacrobiotus metropolitanus]|uniref:probable U6 snRNA-associated Sm-like protein LSm4 n=1 Tax=Paramacrobiotus metropolitanus TaxID=2943436 RepID=UPI0024465C1C|nr:probable U6 snRNA-associated Sm-like protein LSm4 [Paramacrobiotus metropolitanus]
MLPLSLLRGALNHPVLVELKNGETYNGQLANVDNWMNLNLKDVICTSKDGERFWKIAECYVRGSSVKYMRVPDEVAELVKADMARNKSRPDKRPAGGYQGGGGGRGGGRGGQNRGRGGPGRGGGKSFRGGGPGRGAPRNGED